MKQLKGIVISSVEPPKDYLWVHGETVKAFNNGAWQESGLSQEYKTKLDAVGDLKGKVATIATITTVAGETDTQRIVKITDVVNKIILALKTAGILN